MKLTVQNILDSRIPQSIGQCATTESVLSFVNEAVARIFSLDIPVVGRTRRFQFCLNKDCITLPRGILSIESVWVCRKPIPIRSQWFEELPSGVGLRQAGDFDLQWFDKGDGYVGFDDFLPESERIRVYADNPDDAGTPVLFQFYDENNQWVLTENGNVDGQRIELAMPYAESDRFCSMLVGVQKPVTRGPVRVFAHNTVTDTLRAIAVYEPDETLPNYRRAAIYGLNRVGGCRQPQDGGDGEECAVTQVTVMAQMEFVPVRKLTDYVQVGNLPALKEMMQAIRYGEQDDLESKNKARIHELNAIRLLNREWSAYIGKGAQQDVHIITNESYGFRDIENLI